MVGDVAVGVVAPSVRQARPLLLAASRTLFVARDDGDGCYRVEELDQGGHGFSQSCMGWSSMQTYSDRVELARLCMRNARAACSKNVADDLRRMAKEYLATIKVLLRYLAVAVWTSG